jgi:hypothetical protein
MTLPSGCFHGGLLAQFLDLPQLCHVVSERPSVNYPCRLAEHIFAIMGSVFGMVNRFQYGLCCGVQYHR